MALIDATTLNLTTAKSTIPSSDEPCSGSGARCYQSFETGTADHQYQVRDKDKIDQLEHRQDHVRTIQLSEVGEEVRQFPEKLRKNDQQRRQQTQAQWRNCPARELHPIPRDLVQALFRHPQNETPTKLGLMTLFNHVMGASEP